MTPKETKAAAPWAWALHGYTRIHRDMEIGEVIRIGDAVVDVIEKFAYDALLLKYEKAVAETKAAHSDGFLKGFSLAIELLRSDDAKKLSNWSHSRDLNFAAVELSDFLMVQWRARETLAEIDAAALECCVCAEINVRHCPIHGNADE